MLCHQVVSGLRAHRLPVLNELCFVENDAVPATVSQTIPGDLKEARHSPHALMTQQGQLILGLASNASLLLLLVLQRLLPGLLLLEL